jgi:hypothetical protein
LAEPHAAKKIEHSGRFKTACGENHPNYGKSRVAGSGNPSQSIEVTDVQTNNKTSYN